MSSKGDKYIGSIVSVYCEDGSCLQGQLISIDQKNGTFELKHPFRNGRQVKEQKLCVKYTEVSNIKVLNVKQQNSEEIDKNQETNESSSSMSGEKTCLKVLQKCSNSEMEPEIGNCHQTTCSSSLSQSNPTSPTKISKFTSRNLLRNNRVGRSDRWVTKNSCDIQYQKYIPGVSKCNGKRSTHGCGDPVLDSDNGFWVSKRNRHLSKPLDLKTLSTDFDFEGNLALFDKVSIAMDEDCHHFRKSEEKNYKHYENVINDPTRVTSWTTASARCKLDDATHNLYTASRIATTGKGIKMPFLTYEDKQNYLSVAKLFLGSDIFYVQTADRLLMFLWAIIDRFEVMVDELVILTSSLANPVLINRFVQHFSNRACKTVIFGEDSIAVDLPYVRHVSDANDLPDGDGRLVIALDGQSENPDLMKWASRLPMQTHLICLEQPRNLCAIEHVLMIGVGTDLRDGNEHKDDVNGGLKCVTDMGIPFAWLDVHSAACLATAFATEMIVIL